MRTRAEAAAVEGTPPVAILAGSGLMPIEVAASLLRQGRRVHIVALDGFADAAVADFPHTRVGLGQLGRMLTALRADGAREMVIIGGLERPDLRRLRFDLGALRHLPAVLSLTVGGDDTLLRRVVRFFEGQGFTVRGAGELAPELLAGAGLIAGAPLTAGQSEAIDRGVVALAALSPFDLGQAVVARADGVIAFEGSEGTRRMLERLAHGREVGAGESVLVKLPKIGQELRVDLPTIGAATLDQVSAAGVGTIAVAAGKTLLAERGRLVEAAQSQDITIMGLSDIGRGGHSPVPQAVLAPARSWPGVPAALVDDLLLAHQVLDAARPHLADRIATLGAIVRRGHVLALLADDPDATGITERLTKLPRGWGLPAGLASAGLANGGVAVIERRTKRDMSVAQLPAALAATFQVSGLALLVLGSRRADGPLPDGPSTDGLVLARRPALASAVKAALPGIRDDVRLEEGRHHGG